MIVVNDLLCSFLLVADSSASQFFFCLAVTTEISSVSSLLFVAHSSTERCGRVQ